MKMRKRDIRWQEMDKKNIRFDRLIDDFLLAKRSAGCSEKTVSWYRDNILNYVRFLEGEGNPAVLKSFSADSVRRYTVHLQRRRVKFENNPLRRTVGQPLSSQTVFGYVATLGVFATWLAAEGHRIRQGDCTLSRSAASRPAVAASDGQSRLERLELATRGLGISDAQFHGSVTPDGACTTNIG